MQHTILITGAAGYVGAMLVEQFAKRPDVARIIGIDKEALPDTIAKEPKLIYIESNTADAGWEEKARQYAPDIVIHAAWQIREMYGKQDVEWEWNIGGSDRVFDFAFQEPSVARLIYFSTVASYGALASNTIEHRFAEGEPFRKTHYLYAEEKRIAEEHLEKKYRDAKSSGRSIAVSVLRPAAITGPRGRFMRIRFGLQAALSGQLQGSFLYSMISRMVAVVPVTPKWCRQFIHEDDVSDIVERLSFGDTPWQYEAFNICPSGEVVRGADMARAVDKRMIRIHPYLIRIVFFVVWHLTRGRVPTGRGAWKGYSYPIVVDGSKLTRLAGFAYKYSPFDAFYYTTGRYEPFVPEDKRRSK